MQHSPSPPIWSHPNCKSGSFLALREVNLWHHRQAAFASRHAGLAVDYARRQQVWWSKEARRFEPVEIEPAPLP